MSQDLIGRENFKDVSEIIQELQKFRNKHETHGKLPVIFADEKELLYKIDKIEIIGKDGIVWKPKFVVMKGSSIRVVKESKVEIALDRSEADLSKYQEAVRRAVKCGDQEAVDILEELNAQDYLLLSGKDCRKLTEALERKDKDIELLRESLRERSEVD